MTYNVMFKLRQDWVDCQIIIAVFDQKKSYSFEYSVEKGKNSWSMNGKWSKQIIEIAVSIMRFQ